MQLLIPAHMAPLKHIRTLVNASCNSIDRALAFRYPVGFRNFSPTVSQLSAKHCSWRLIQHVNNRDVPLQNYTGHKQGRFISPCSPFTLGTFGSRHPSVFFSSQQSGKQRCLQRVGDLQSVTVYLGYWSSTENSQSPSKEVKKLVEMLCSTNDVAKVRSRALIFFYLSNHIQQDLYFSSFLFVQKPCGLGFFVPIILGRAPTLEVCKSVALHCKA